MGLLSDWRKVNKAALFDLEAERLMGATNIGGVVGNGELSCGISRWGELTVFRWPTPSHFDQLDYVTKSALHRPVGRVRMGRKSQNPDFRRWGRPYALSPHMGSFAGIIHPGIARRETVWFHDPMWEFAQRYKDGSSHVLETTMVSRELGLGVRITDFVLPESPVLVRRFTLEHCGEAHSGKTGEPDRLRIVFYEDFAPSSRRTSLFPLDRYLGFGKDDFALVYDPGSRSFLHFNPEGSRAKRRRSVGCDPGGSFIAWGSDREPLALHVCPSGGKGVFALASVGCFPGTRRHVGRCAAAAAWGVSIDREGEGPLTVCAAVSGDAGSALESLEDARSRDYRDLLRETVEFWKEEATGSRSPGGTGEASARVSRRALSTVALCRDRRSGSVVASVACQPRYCLDWPRDGAFLDLVLDLAGRADWVTQHLDFYASHQYGSFRIGPVGLYIPSRPPGHFPSNLYTDGKRGNITYTETDETGLVLWDVWRHASFLDPGERRGFLERLYPCVRKGADALERLWRPGKGMRKRYHEGDNPFRTRTLYGLVACYTGLLSASLVARLLNSDHPSVSGWERTAMEMKESSLELFDERSGKFKKPGWQGPRWAVWPAGILPWYDDRASVLAARLLDDFERMLSAERSALTYQLENLLVAALVFRGDRSKTDRIGELLETVCSLATTPGTHHFGEVTLRADFDGDGSPEYQNRTSIPHLWKGALVYLLATALEDPERLDECVPNPGTNVA